MYQDMQEMKKDKVRIVLTGGHGGTPALSIIETLRKDDWNWDIYWIGSKYSFVGKRVLTLEFRVFPKFSVKCFSLIFGRLQRKWTLWTIPVLFKIPVGIIQAFFLVFYLRPKIILSFGGFAAFPVALAGFILGIPVIIHEQTVSVGLSNKISSYFARVVIASWQESMEFLPKKKTVVIGNPVINSILNVPKKKRPGARRVIYITGGSRGSQAINKSVAEILEKLLSEGYVLIHQTGDVDFQKFQKIASLLPSSYAENYQVHAFIDPMGVSSVYAESDLIISRAGANTVTEILLIGRPAIIIPIPWTHNDEQTQNAQLAERARVALVISESELTGGVLYDKINYIFDNWSQFSISKFEDTEDIRSASREIVKLVKKNVR